MRLKCNIDGSECIRRESNESKRLVTNSTVGFILGIIASLLFIIIIVGLMYILCCKGCLRRRIRLVSRSRSNNGNEREIDQTSRTEKTASTFFWEIVEFFFPRIIDLNNRWRFNVRMFFFRIMFVSKNKLIIDCLFIVLQNDSNYWNFCLSIDSDWGVSKYVLMSSILLVWSNLSNVDFF